MVSTKLPSAPPGWAYFNRCFGAGAGVPEVHVPSSKTRGNTNAGPLRAGGRRLAGTHRVGQVTCFLDVGLD